MWVLLAILSLLLSNLASYLIKQWVFASKDNELGMVNVVLRASLASLPFLLELVSL
jgi:hypothetical protein